MGTVYLLEEFRNDDRAFKIGFTKGNVNNRIKQLQTGNSDEIVLVKYYNSIHYNKIEKFLHNKFNSQNKRGEWFSLDDSIILTFIDSCKEIESNIIFLSEHNHFYN